MRDARATTAGTTAALVGVALVVWIVILHVGPYDIPGLSDLPVYEGYARQMAHGAVPYRDVPIEYPPLAAGLFWLARIIPGPYSTVFSALMLACLVATLLGVLATGRALGVSPARLRLAGLAVAVSPLLIGNLVEMRFDLAFVAVLAWLAWAVVSGRFATAWTLVAVGALLKVATLAFTPLLLLLHLRARGGRRAAGGLAGCLAVIAAVVAPFAVMAPSGTWRILGYHVDRPLQIETVGASYLEVLHSLVDRSLTVVTSYGSQGLPGPGPDAVAAIASALLVVAVLAIAASVALLLRRARPADARLIVHAGMCATLVALLVFGKVLSPQFLLWLLPFAFLVGGRYGIVTFALGVASLLVTLAYFPHLYWSLVAMNPAPIAVLAIRNALLIALLAAAWPRPIPAVTGSMVARKPDMPDDVAERAMPARYLID